VDKGCTGASVRGTRALKVDDLPASSKEKVRKGIASDSREGAEAALTELIAQRDACRESPTAMPDCPK
jgi:hypothetical protein